MENMAKACETVKRIAGYVIAICMLLQIGMGFYWAAHNIMYVPRLKETTEYLTAAQSLLVDEYMGILYPLFLRCVLAIEGVTGLPFQIPVYILQLLLAGTVLSLFLKEVFASQKRRPLLLFYLLTIPMLLQYHMTVLPNSFLFSVSVLLITLGIKIWKKNRACGKELLFLCALWIAAALLHPDYLFISGVWLFFYFAAFLIRVWRVQKKEAPDRYLLLKTIGGFVCALAVILLVNGMTQTPGSHGRMQRTVEAVFFERLVGQNFANTYFFWPDEVKKVISLTEAEEIAKRSDNLRYEAGPALEAAIGETAANEAYMVMARECFRVRTKETLYRIRDDFCDYLFMPFSVLSPGGNGHISATGFHYARLTEQCPRLGRWYFWGSLYGMLISLFVSAMAAICRILSACKAVSAQKPVYRQKTNGTAGWIFLFILLQALWYTISSSMPVDYGNVLIAVLGWYLPAACVFAGENLD